MGDRVLFGLGQKWGILSLLVQGLMIRFLLEEGSVICPHQTFSHSIPFVGRSTAVASEGSPSKVNISRGSCDMVKVSRERNRSSVVMVSGGVAGHGGFIHLSKDHLARLSWQPQTSLVVVQVDTNTSRGTGHICCSEEQIDLGVSIPSSSYNSCLQTVQETFEHSWAKSC